MKNVTFRTEGMSCPSCVKKIEVAVSRLPGVSTVQVLFTTAKVKTSFDETLTNESIIAATIDRLGYHVL